MKRIPQLLILICYVFTTGFAQEWVRQAPYPILESINDIDIDESGSGWAVGESGLLLHTDNNGNFWAPQEHPQGTFNLRSIEVLPGSNGQAAFTGATRLIKTTDGGQNWVEVDDEDTWPVNFIQATSNNVVYLITNKVAKSTDAGISWSELDIPETSAPSSLSFIDDNVGWISISNNVYKTTDGGQSWTQSNGGNTFESIIEIRFANANTGYLIDNSRTVFKTTDGGASWTATTNGEVRFGVITMELADDNNIWICYNNAVYAAIKSTDGGLTWEEIRYNQQQVRKKGLFVQDANTIWIGAEFSTLIYSDDGGTSWTDKIPGNKDALIDIEFFDNNLGIAAGFNGTILRTIDGGAIWEEVDTLTSSSVSRWFEHVFILDEDNFWITGRDNYFSNDQGRTWTKMNGPGGGYSIYAIDEDHILIGTSNGRIYLSTDGGMNFSQTFQSSLSADIIYDIEFKNELDGFAMGSKGKLYLTGDGGNNWSEHPTLNDRGFKAMYFLDDQYGWLSRVNRKDTMYRTVDGGVTWEPVQLTSTYIVNDLHFVSKDLGWFSGGAAGIGYVFQTQDGGLTWEEIHRERTTFYGIDIPDFSDQRIWVSGQNGTIMHRGSCGSDPVINSLNGDLVPCEGDTVTYTVTGENLTEFFWTIPDGWVLFGNSNSAQIQIIAGDQSGTINVHGSNTCINSDTITLEVFPQDAPDAPVITNNGQTLNTSTSASSYQWFKDGVSIPGAISNSYIATESGTYTLKVSDGNCFSQASNAIEITITSTRDLSELGGTLFPNPSSGQFVLELPTQTSGQLYMNVYDIEGSKVIQYQLNNVIRHELDLSHLSAGMYQLFIHTTKDSYQSKLVILK